MLPSHWFASGCDNAKSLADCLDLLGIQSSTVDGLNLLRIHELSYHTAAKFGGDQRRDDEPEGSRPLIIYLPKLHGQCLVRAA